MKRFQRIFSTGMAIALAFSFAACGASSAGAPAASSSAAYATEKYDMSEEMVAAPASAANAAESGSTAMPVTLDPSRKLIRNVLLEIETKEYDVLTKTVMEQISLLGGYIEKSQMVGGSYIRGGAEYDDYYRPSGGSRYASIVARVPQNKVDAFIAALGEHGSIRNRQESVRDVTLEYVDVESHKKSLAIEYERLLSLLEKADKLEAIVQLESRLSDVRYQIQSYESQLRTFDNLVSYSTVDISITEVERIAPIKEEQKTVGQRISAGFSNTMFRLKTGAENFLVWFVVELPFLIIWAVIITAAVLIGRKMYAAREASEERKPRSRKKWGKKKADAKLAEATDAELTEAPEFLNKPDEETTK